MRDFKQTNSLDFEVVSSLIVSHLEGGCCQLDIGFVLKNWLILKQVPYNLQLVLETVYMRPRALALKALWFFFQFLFHFQ